MNSGIRTRWHICRICLGNNNKELYTIFGENEDGKSHMLENLQEKIELYGGIKISNHNNLPNKICNRCLLLLRAACKFRDLCEQSEKQLEPFIETPKVETNLDGDHIVTNTELDNDCLLIGPGDHEIDDYVTEESMKQPSPPPLSEQSHYSIKGFGNVDECDDATDVALPHDGDHLVDEDPEDYVFEPANESSQDTQDQLMTEDASNPYDIDHDNLHIQYYAVSNGIDDTKFMAPAEPSDINEEIDNTIVKNVRKKSRALKDKAKIHVNLYKCQYCENVYHDKAKYALHIKIHKQVKPHECEICGKRFSTTPQLSRHMNSHTGNRPYKCNYCDACFGDPSTRIKHERIHTNERPYKCDRCPKSFAYSNVLKVHMMVHTGEKPYICSYCDKSFSQIHHKNSHEKRHRTLLNAEMDDNDVDFEDDLKEYEIEKI